MKFLVFFMIYGFAFLSHSQAARLSESEALIRDAKKIAVYIGTFDPPHLGHQKIIEGVIESGLVDLAIIIPQNLTLHKPHASGFDVRLSYLDALYADHPQILVPDANIESYKVGQSYWKLVSDGFHGKASIGGMVLDFIQRTNPRAQLLSLIGTDILGKAYMKVVNFVFLRKFAGLIVAVWTDAPESANVVVPKTFGRLPVFKMELSGLPRISSSNIRKSLQSGVWPEELDTRLSSLIPNSGSCLAFFK